MKNTGTNKAFTLIELAIVLVIIGLLVAGVLAGQQLIALAKIKKATTEFGNLEAAYNTFRLKYNAIPGDVPKPERYFPPCTTSGSSCLGPSTIRGDGNGIIDNSENTCEWMQMAYADVLNVGVLKQGTSPAVNCPDEDIDASKGGVYPFAPWPGDELHTMTIDYQTYVGTGSSLQDSNMLIVQEKTLPDGNMGPLFSGKEISDIDTKLDDGKPGSGIVGASLYNGTTCFDHATNVYPTHLSEYNVNDTSKRCLLLFKMK